ncbi:MAG: HAMP domain-containing protein, partial [Lysinibacillus sp.]|nr:HAMP domain-containing protein [Lysinibacillus sp.]
MSIKNKLITAFGITIVVTVLASTIIFNQLIAVEKIYSRTLDENLPQTFSNAELNRFVMAQASLVQTYIMGKDVKEAIQTHRDEVNGMIQHLDESISEDNQVARELVESVKEKAKIMHDGFDEAIALKDSEGYEAAASYYVDVAGTNVITFMDDATALFNEVTNAFTDARSKAKGKSNSAIFTTIIAIVIVIIVGIVVSLVLSSKIAKPLIHLEKYIQEITKGNLKIEPVQIHTNDEIGHLSKAINELKETLSKLILNLSESASHLNNTSEKLVASTEEVNTASSMMFDVVKEGSTSASAMASSALESATAMDETALGIQKIAESAQELFKFASQTEDIASKGSVNIKTASEQMLSIYESTKLTTELIQKLSKQSEEIENITQVITSITEQTNLLALNAAIEAARAGEHGKGFAVVADEVRKLAEESNRSAGQIVTLTNEIRQDTKNVEMAVQESLDNVHKGVGIIDDVGNSFNTIVEAIVKVKAQLEDVSAVTEQISAAAEEVAASVTEIARTAEETNKNVQESYKSAEAQRNSLQEV